MENIEGRRESEGEVNEGGRLVIGDWWLKYPKGDKEGVHCRLKESSKVSVCRRESIS